MVFTLFASTTVESAIRGLLNIGERLGNDAEIWQRNNDALSAAIRVAVPAKVVSFDAEKQTIVAQPLIRERVIYRDTGDVEFVDLPQLLDVPVIFMQAGNFALTFPIQEDDEVLIIFADMCIDSWWAQGDIQNWNDRRRHDLSDGIAIVGMNSVPNVIPNIADDAVELRTKEDGAKVRLTDNSIEIVAGESEPASIKVENNSITADTKAYNFPQTILMPTGSVIDFVGSNAPTGWLLCDGSSYSTTDYADLFSVIGYTFGGAGSSFNVPDLRGRTSIGKDNMGGSAAGRVTSASLNGANAVVLGGVGGLQTHSLVSGENGPHAHTYTRYGNLTTFGGGAGTNMNQNTSTQNTSTSGSGDPHNNMQPWMALNKIIFANVS